MCVCVLGSKTRVILLTVVPPGESIAVICLLNVSLAAWAMLVHRCTIQRHTFCFERADLPFEICLPPYSTNCMGSGVGKPVL